MQETRNKYYAAVVAIFGLAVTFGLIDQATSTELLALISQLLDAAFVVAAVVGSVMAWWKSRTKTTTVIDVPKDTVVEVITTAGHPNVDANSEPIAA